MSDPNYELVVTLEQACSQNGVELRAAEQKLKGWETTPGFYQALAVSWLILICDPHHHVSRICSFILSPERGLQLQRLLLGHSVASSALLQEWD